MPVEAAKSPTSNPVPLADANAQNTPKKKQAVGKAALAKITLLDGSVLDVTIDVSESRWTIFQIELTIFLLSAEGKRKRFNQFDLCRFEYHRKRLFWTFVLDADRSTRMARSRETSVEIFQDRSMDIAICR